MKKSSAAISRSPPGPRTTSVPRSASSAAGRSEAGSPWAIEPPIVPRWRTWGSPIWPGDVRQQRHLLVRQLGGGQVVVAGERADAHGAAPVLDDDRSPMRADVDQHGGLPPAAAS